MVKLVNVIPNTPAGRVIGDQLLRAGTSVGSNYRVACRAKSKADFIYKINIVEEKVDESAFWIGLIVESGLMSKNKIDTLLSEADELAAIFVSTIKTAKSNK